MFTNEINLYHKDEGKRFKSQLQNWTKLPGMLKTCKIQVKDFRKEKRNLSKRNLLPQSSGDRGLSKPSFGINHFKDLLYSIEHDDLCRYIFTFHLCI